MQTEMGRNAATNGAMILASYAQQGGHNVLFTAQDALELGLALDRVEDAHLDDETDFWGETVTVDYESACWTLAKTLHDRENITTEEADELVEGLLAGTLEI